MPRYRSFSARLLGWFVVLAIAPAAVMAVVAFFHLRDLGRSNVQRHLAAVARARAAAVEARLEEYREHAARLADPPVPVTAGGVSYGVVDREGRPKVAGGAALDPRDVETLRNRRPVHRGGHVLVGAPQPDGGAAVARIPVARVVGLLAEVRGETHLVDAEGRILGGNAVERAWRATPREEPAVYEDYRGVEVLGAWAPVGDWWVTAEMDVAESEAPLRGLAATLLALGGLFFVLVMGALLLVGFRTERSLKAMVESVERAARGDFGAEVEGHAFAEIDRVQSALNQMHKSLAERDAEILRQRQELFCQRCEVERVNAEIVQADRMKSEFVANMSHEVRTPLHSVLTLCDVLLKETSGALTGEQRKQVGIIERNGRALFAMLGDILDFSKIEAGRMPVSPSDVTPGAVLAGVREAVAPEARAKGLELVLDVPEGMPPLRTDPEKLHRVLLNLAHNAVKFTREGSVILQVARHDDGRVAFVVKDTGPGIAAAELERIFEPFHQADGSTRRTEGGTGLGLSIARSLVELLGGRIGIESEPGRGTTFQVVLPERIPGRFAAGPRSLADQHDVIVLGATPPAAEAVRAELQAAGFHVARAVCGRDVRTAVERGGHGTVLLDVGIFAHEGVDIFTALAPRLAGGETSILGYWVDETERRGGYLGTVRFSADEAKDAFRVLCEHAPPLALPRQVGNDERKAGAGWVAALATGGEPFHEVVRTIIGQLDTTLAVPPIGEGREILLLDPDADARYSMTLQLERMGFQVHAHAEMAAIPASCRPAAVVMELSLPDVADAVAALRGRLEVPIVVVTADARADVLEAARVAGAHDVLVKPVPTGMLRRILSTVAPEVSS